ncbi:hypothetical protein OKA05_09015 [Luteolibacter arcticus]|uniref:Uncharacterized protein n=1 Tax=Luteolibacter arcticus TaxID=1581411 RepID=A0ABT3GGE5_9BACT|nr:hypothetical protein [Luteolibacter arcticus]MCW1922692.1 hypothetical protein [Luteolibacter arcticus]
MPRTLLKPRVSQRAAGLTTQAATRLAKERGQFCTFEDVHRACHRWLMKRDPIYRQQRENFEAGDRSSAKPFLGF